MNIINCWTELNKISVNFIVFFVMA